MNAKLFTAALMLAGALSAAAWGQIPGDNRPVQENNDAVPGDNRPIQRFVGNLGNPAGNQSPAQAPQLVGGPNRIMPPFSGGAVYGWDDGYPGSATAIGDSMRGAASIIRSTGEAVRNGSEAAVNIEAAKSQYLKNNYDAAKTFWDKRLLWAENSAFHRGSPLSSEQLRQMARDAAPDRLSVLQLSPATGEITWPAGLLRPEFEGFRARAERIFANRTISNSGVGSTTEVAVSRLTGVVRDDLKAQIDEMTPSEYIVAKNFLRSLAYEARFVPGVEGVAGR